SPRRSRPGAGPPRRPAGRLGRPRPPAGRPPPPPPSPAPPHQVPTLAGPPPVAGSVAGMASDAGEKLPIKMVNDRILVKLAVENERRSSGGILIPATAEMKKRLVWGEVCGAGP